MKLISILLLFLLSLQFSNFAKDEDEIVAVAYFNEVFGHIHMNADRQSQSLSTIACGHPLRILKQKEEQEGFKLVKAGPYKGFIHQSLLSQTQPSCVQESYPKFFDLLNLSLSEMYFWGKLQDQAVEGKSKVQ